MQILGLTGSIAMGKSTVAKMLQSMNLPVHDADKCVHELFKQSGKAVPMIKTLFPDAIVSGAVDRGVLAQLTLGDPKKLSSLEALVHPLVAESRNNFLKHHRRLHSRVVVLDVPLLFETGGGNYCSSILVVTAPKFLQERRALSRPGMTPGKLDAILRRQLPDVEKRKRATVVVPTGLGKAFTYRVLQRFIALILRPA